MKTIEKNARKLPTNIGKEEISDSSANVLLRNHDKTPILILQNITKIYNQNEPSETVALKDISMSVNPGEFISIMGPSGSGKTTLLNLIGLLDHPTKGELIINSKNIKGLSRKEMTILRRNEIGFIFQSFNLLPLLSVRENVELPLVLSNVEKDERTERVNRILELVGLSDKKEKLPGQLSGGETQRVAICRALINEPSIVLADEPTGNLDTRTGEAIMDLFRKLNEELGQTFIIVTHDERIAKKTDKILFLRDGRFEN